MGGWVTTEMQGLQKESLDNIAYKNYIHIYFTIITAIQKRKHTYFTILFSVCHDWIYR